MDLIPGIHEGPLNIEITSLNYTMTSAAYWLMLLGVFVASTTIGSINGACIRKSYMDYYYSKKESPSLYISYPELDFTAFCSTDSYLLWLTIP
jgi:hypothetical protein